MYYSCPCRWRSMVSFWCLVSSRRSGSRSWENRSTSQWCESWSRLSSYYVEKSLRTEENGREVQGSNRGSWRRDLFPYQIWGAHAVSVCVWRDDWRTIDSIVCIHCICYILSRPADSGVEWFTRLLHISRVWLSSTYFPCPSSPLLYLPPL